MTIQEFASKLEDFYHRGKAEEPKTFKAGCLLPWALRGQEGEVQALIPGLRVVVRKEQTGIYVEVWGR